MHAIPTVYGSVRFRSRLEAKWAAFFDLCRWRWSYEPLDLPGWIPDFAIGWKPTFVEVKPFFRADQFSGVLADLAASGHTDPVVLLGAEPFQPRNYMDWWCPVIGWLAEIDPGTEAWTTTDLHFGYTEGNDYLGLCPLEGRWTNVIWKPPAEGCTHPNKWSRVANEAHGRINCVSADDLLEKYWAMASNAVQWKAREAVGQ